ncbi:Ankyrin [Chitinispirillum alkaliphilum]|nr:Ankyrin [Chitinispirillum alkaliphilum]
MEFHTSTTESEQHVIGLRRDTGYRLYSLLSWAASLGDTSLCALILEQGAKLNVFECERNAPLRVAAAAGHEDCAIFLIKKGAPIDAVDFSGKNILHYAAQTGSMELLRTSLQAGVDPNFRTKNGRTALMLAALNGHLEILDTLIYYGADPNLIDNFGANSLLLALLNDNADCMSYLSQLGLSFPSHISGDQILWFISHTGTLGQFKRLIELDAKGELEFTRTMNRDGGAVFRALHNPDPEIVKYLLENNFEFDFEWIESISLRRTVGDLINSGNFGNLKLLFEHGFNPSTIDHQSKSLLYTAVKSNKYDIARLILEYGVNPNRIEGVAQLFSTPQTTSLIQAVTNNNLEMVTLLCEYGADVNLVPEHGESALHIAAREGYSGVMRVLIEHGADLFSSHDFWNNTPFTYALRSGNQETVLLLENAGALDTARIDLERELANAAGNSNTDIIDYLLQKGVDPHTSAFSEDILLVRAVSAGHIDVLHQFLELGLNPNNPSFDDPILYKIPYDSTDILSLLVKYGADIHNTRRGTTILEYATFGQSYEFIKYLLDTGEWDCSVLEKALINCLKRGRYDVVERLKKTGVEISRNWDRNELIEIFDIALTEGNTNLVKKMWRRMKIRPDYALEASVKHGHYQITQFLIRRGADVNSYGKKHLQIPPFLQAVENDDIETARLLINSGARVDTVHNGYNALYRAVSNGNKEIVKLLLAYGVCKYSSDNEGTHLKEALKQRDDREIFDILGFDYEIIMSETEQYVNNDPTLRPEELLCDDLSGYYNLYNILKKKTLDAYGADLNTICYGSSVYDIIMNSGYYEAIKLILKDGADPNIINLRSRNRGTPLLTAIQNNNKLIAFLLLEYGADPNIANRHGETPLMFAVQNGFVDLAATLIEAGADVFAVSTPRDNREEINVASVAENKIQFLPILNNSGLQDISLNQFYNAVVSGKLRSITEHVPLFKERNNPEYKNSQALWWASSPVVVKKLLELGYDPDIRNKEGITYFMYTVQKGRFKTAELLLRHGADINAFSHDTDRYSRLKGNALMQAVKSRKYTTVSWLLKNGADPNLENKEDDFHTALSYAVQRGNEQIASLLLEYGAKIPVETEKIHSLIQRAISNDVLSIVQAIFEDELLHSTAFKKRSSSDSPDARNQMNIFSRPSRCYYTEHLTNAVSQIRPRHVFLIIEHGADSLHSNISAMPLRKALEKHRHSRDKDSINQIISRLLIEGIFSTDAIEDIENALVWAVNENFPEAVQAVLKRMENTEHFKQTISSMLKVSIATGNVKLTNQMLDYVFTEVFTFEKEDTLNLFHTAIRYGDANTFKRLIDNGFDALLVMENGENLLWKTKFSPFYCRVNQKQTTSDSSGMRSIITDLCDMGININAQNNEGKTALHQACYNRDYEMIKTLVENGARTDIQDNQGMTPLTKATKRGFHEPVHLLATNESVVNIQDSLGNTAIHYATQRYSISLDLIETLLQLGADYRITNHNGNTLLTNLIESAQEPLLRWVIEQTDRFPEAKELTEAALVNSARRCRTESIQFLLDNNISVQSRDSSGRSVLNAAAANCWSEIISLLLSEGARVNEADALGVTPLLSSVYHNRNTEVTELLLNADADPNRAEDFWGQTPLMIASSHRHSEEITTMLLRKGADMNARDFYGWSPLVYAIRAGNHGVSKILIENGADVNATDLYGWTPLFHAVSSRSDEIIGLLLKSGAEVNITNDSGIPILHHAAKTGNTDALRLLLDRGADILLTDNKNRTIFDYAEDINDDIFLFLNSNYR